MFQKRRFIVSGRVQGVWYRVCTEQQARRLGLTGWARNMPDGTVEVLACGESEQVGELGQWLWTGSPQAKVESVKEQPATQEQEPPRDFSIG